MAINQLFRVATEFKFEVGAAVLGASGLQSQVQKLSDSADNALLSFQRLGVGIAANMGIGSGGAIGLIQKAIQVSEKFRDAQIKFSTIFAANRDKFIGPVDDFNSRMLVSEGILQRIAREAKKFSLPEEQLASQASLLAAQLGSKGLAGTNLDNAINISRDFLKAAPVLGVSPGQSQNQLLNIIEGAAGGNNTLFRRLAGETDAFKEFVGNAAKFNRLKPAERVKKLTEGLRQFTSQADEVAARTQLVSSALQNLRNVVSGFDSILKPLGDQLGPLFSKLIQDVTNTADTDFRKLFMSLSETVKLLVPDIQTLVVNLIQLREAARDTTRAIQTLGILGILGIVGKFVSFFTILRPLVTLMGGFLGVVGGLFRGIGGLGLIFKVLGFAVTKLFAPFAILLSIFQIISRARAIAQAEDIKRLPAIAAQFTELGNRAIKALAGIFKPVTDAINLIAELISPLFQVSTFLSFLLSPVEGLVILLEKLATVSLLAQAGFAGIFTGLLQFVENIKSGKIFSAFDGVSDAFKFGTESFFERNADLLNQGKGPVSNQVTNIGKVEIKNEFRENLEPDRIAFSLQKQLLKTAQAPTQARGRSFTRGASSSAIGGN